MRTPIDEARETLAAAAAKGAAAANMVRRADEKLRALEAELEPLLDAYEAASGTHFAVLGRAQLGEATPDELATASAAQGEADAARAKVELARDAVAARREQLTAELKLAIVEIDAAKANLAALLASRELPAVREAWRAAFAAQASYLALLREANIEVSSGAAVSLGPSDEPRSIHHMARGAALKSENFGLRPDAPRITVPRLLELAASKEP
ncbi:MAG: hypothetical protein U0414_22420 [Polyangiaceae bacterium]